MTVELTRAEVLALLRARVIAAGSQKAFAVASGISEAHLSKVLSGQSEPGDLVLRALGLTRVTRFVGSPA